MISVFISYGNNSTGEWEQLCTIPLLPFSELYPADNVDDDSWGINNHEFSLPNGETLEISVAFTEYNLGVSFGVEKDGASLVSVYCFKQKLKNNDPCVLFLTPGGQDVSIMLGQQS